MDLQLVDEDRAAAQTQLRVLNPADEVHVHDISVERDGVLLAGLPAVLVIVAREDVVVARELSALLSP